jgi:outer membrane protein assembly factor BamB
MSNSHSPAGRGPGLWNWFLVAGLLALASPPAPGATRGWLSWRGPSQNGVSMETRLPEWFVPGGSNELWTAEFPGQSTPVIANGRVYAVGYLGEGPDLQEGVACFDAVSGRKLWERLYSDYLSDTVYLRYATSSPTVDAETGTVFFQGTQGVFTGLTPDGEVVWKHDLMERFGRLTFPNSRTASPVVDRDLVITRGITANWGAQGAAGDRFYAFDKKSGELVWASSPGDRPKDNSYSHPQLLWLNGKRVFIAATGDGSVVCVNVRTGEPLWRVPLFKAGINATVLVHQTNTVVAVYGTPYELGQMVAFKMPQVNPAPGTGPVVIERSSVELWSLDVSTSTSSPILVGDVIYVVAEKGDLCAVDIHAGKLKWKLKLGIEQRNACPLYADGRLYIPILDDPAGKSVSQGEAGVKGAFYIVKPGETEGRILSHAEVQGRCFGSPAVCDGRVYFQTTRRLYCFGPKDGGSTAAVATPAEFWPEPGKPAQLQMIPAEVNLHPGEKASVRARVLDANGLLVEEVADASKLRWTPYVPPTARVKSFMKASFNDKGEIQAGAEPTPSAGAFEATLGDLKGYLRGRVMPNLPLREDFQSVSLSEKNSEEPDSAFAYPPLAWIGARFKFDVREKDGTKALAKTIDNKFFQRAMVFIGTPEMKNYTVAADVMSDGNRRKMSEVGIINQRYLVVLKGNDQKLEINSNLERLRSSVDFKWSPNAWYRLLSRVDMAPDGSAVVRAKAWKVGEPEPASWTIEVPHKNGHASGSPGLFGFSPQDMKVYLDNVVVTPN